MKFEHPEFYGNPIKQGECEIFHFKNWQDFTGNERFNIEERNLGSQVRLVY